MAAPLSVLIVGAGSVGQVFARHLQLGGAEVTFFVREKYRQDAARGFDLYPLNHRRDEPERLEGFGVVTSPTEVAARRFDMMFLTVSSTGLRGPWLEELVAAAPDATVVSLQPGVDDRGIVMEAGVPAERLVSGLIGFLSYAAPLPGEAIARPGMAYWFPPMSPCRFSGAPDRVRAVVEALSRGRLPARIDADVPRATAFGTAILLGYVAALERAGWSIRSLVHGEWLATAARGVGEAFAVLAPVAGQPPLVARLLAHPVAFRLVIWFGQRVAPFPLERYLEKHFSKVQDQTRLVLASMVARGRSADLEVGALERLVGSRVP